MKIYSQTADSPDGVQAWAHEDQLLESRYSTGETKVTMDPFASLLRDLPTSSSSLAELKPLDPLDYLTASPDTSAAVRHDPSPTSSTSPNQYKGAITNNNTFLGCGTPEPVSTTTFQLSSSNQPVKQEPPSYSIPQEIEDIASIIGSAISDSTLNPTMMGGMITDTLEPLNPADLDIDAWLDCMSTSVKHEPADRLTVNLPSLFTNIQGATQVQAPSTTTNLISTTLNTYEPHLLQVQPPQQVATSSPMLKSLLAAGTINNNYIPEMTTDIYTKHDMSMPILEARLTQDLKDMNSRTSLSSSDCVVTKSAPNYISRSSYDCIPHSTDQTTYAVTTTDDLLLCKYDRQSYLDKTQIDSPESSDLSSTKYGLDYTDLKGKNRNRMKHAKLPIRTEGGKDKPVHHCNVCHRGFLNKSNIKVHLRTHTGEKPFKCETCNKPFRQKAHLLKHYQIHRREQVAKPCVVE